MCTSWAPTIIYTNAERIVRNLYGMILINAQVIRSYKYMTTKTMKYR